MVAIPANRVGKYVQGPDAAVRAFLFYGTDSGRIRAYSSTLLAHLSRAFDGDPEIIRLTEEDLLENPDRLTVEIQTLSMFSRNKLIRVQAAGRVTALLAEGPWEDLSPDIRVVVEAGQLQKTAKLRKIFETSKGLVALPCYESDDASDLLQRMRGEVREAGLAMDRQAERHLVSLLKGDPALAQSEIAKLTTYASDTDKITVDDVENIVGDVSRVTLEAAVDAILSGDTPAALKEIDRLTAGGTSLDGLLTALSQHVLRLLRMSARMSAGASADGALKTFRPPVHFRRADKMKQQIRSWDRENLQKILELCARAQKQARLNPHLAQAIVTQMITTAHTSARPSSRR